MGCANLSAHVDHHRVEIMTVKVLFVCMGNICRSPTAHGVFAHRVREHGLDHLIEIDSAGTHAYHVGEPPDDRSQVAAARRGYDLSDLKARRVGAKDCEHYDYILVMDEMNLLDVRSKCPRSCWPRVRLFMDFAGPSHQGKEVPDPYSGSKSDFERVLDLVEIAAKGLLQHIRETHRV
ncbi:MAG: low molecular weight protein-tyrosine-phosphatase [Thiotrichales bacterium]